MRPSLHQHELRDHPLYRQMLESRRRAAEEHERKRRLILAGCIVSFLFWTALSVLISSWGMHTVAMAHHSRTIIESGVLLGSIGILCTLLFAYERLRR